MSQTRKDYIDVERLLVNEKRTRASMVTGVQSSTIGDNAAGIQLYATGSSDLTQFLPAEANNEGKELEFFVTDTSSANLVLKNASGDVKVIVPPNGYGKAVCIKGVWYGADGGVQNRLSQVALGAALAGGFVSMASGAGFSASAEGTAMQSLVNKLRGLAIAHGWAIS